MNDVRAKAWKTRREKYGEHGHSSTAYSTYPIGTLTEHLRKALECLTDEFNAGRAGPSGLRAQAITHVRYALMLANPPAATASQMSEQ